eukprot:3860576-Amphidinium_carterae.1
MDSDRIPGAKISLKLKTRCVMSARLIKQIQADTQDAKTAHLANQSKCVQQMAIDKFSKKSAREERATQELHVKLTKEHLCKAPTYSESFLNTLMWAYLQCSLGMDPAQSNMESIAHAQAAQPAPHPSGRVGSARRSKRHWAMCKATGEADW